MSVASDAFYAAINDCKAVSERQKSETGKHFPTFGSQYGYKARRIIATALYEAAEEKKALVYPISMANGDQRIIDFFQILNEQNAVPGPGQKHGSLYSYLIKKVVAAGVSRPTINVWLKKYTPMFHHPDLDQVNHDGHCFISEM